MMLANLTLALDNNVVLYTNNMLQLYLCTTARTWITSLLRSSREQFRCEAGNGVFV